MVPAALTLAFLAGFLAGWGARAWLERRRRRAGILIPGKALTPLLSDPEYSRRLMPQIADTIARWTRREKRRDRKARWTFLR